MRTKTRDHEKRTDIEAPGRLTTTGALYHTYLGVDANGYHHHHNGDTDRMYVVHPEGDVKVEPMLGRSLDTWAQFIADETEGWYDLQLSTLPSASDLFGEVFAR